MMARLDWQHVVIGVVGIGCATACVILGKGDLLLRILAGIGGISGVAALFKSPPGGAS
jgi:hypothetical protein